MGRSNTTSYYSERITLRIGPPKDPALMGRAVQNRVKSSEYPIP